MRLWIRARSLSKGSVLTLPSVWAYPAGGYQDLAGLTAPSGVSVTTPSGDVAHVTWTNGETMPVELLLTTGSAPATCGSIR
jgi:hypothetical protein